MKKNSMAYDTAVYSLWFGLNYGSILTACALYKTLEQYGKHPALLQKQPALWGEHYAEKDNIAGRFAYQNCNVLEVFDSEEDARILREDVQNYVVGSDVVWNYEVVGKQSGLYYFLENVPADKRKIAYASCLAEHLLQREKPETIAADCCINSMGLRLKNTKKQKCCRIYSTSHQKWC